MNKMIRLLLMMLVIPLIASAQFQFADRLPEQTYTAESHGLVVDNDGNVWNGIYNSKLFNEGLERRNTVSVFDSEGNELDFSPIFGVTTGDSLMRFGPITGVNKDPNGNILVASHGFRTTAAAEGSIIGGVWLSNNAYIHVIDAETGEGIETIDVTYMRTETASHAPNRPAVTEDGFVAVSFVFPASPIIILDPSDNWSVLNTLTNDKTGFSRTLEISADGSKVFNPNTEPYSEGGAPGHIQVWEGEVFGEYAVSTPLAVGTDPGAIARYPNSDLIFFSGGGSGNAELGGTLFKGDRFYGANINTGTIVTSFDWDYAEGEAYKTPRSMAFSDDGQTAYVGTFTPGVLEAPGASGVQKFDLAGEINDNAVSVKFTVNTATIPDTVTVNDLVQIRGAVNNAEQTNYFGQTINWGDGSITLGNAGGDYWSTNVSMAPGDTLTYKFFTAKAIEGGVEGHFGTDTGWEAGDNNVYIVPEDASGNIELPVIYFNRTMPFESKEPDSLAIFFRVNVGAQVASNEIPEGATVGVRGSLNDWSSTFAQLELEPASEGNKNVFYSGTYYIAADSAGKEHKYKYVIEDGTNINWETTPDRDGKVGQSDTTQVYSFFSDTRPPLVEPVDASLQFAVNVGVLEGLGFFNPAIDSVYVPGAFNGWDTQTTSGASFNQALNVWTLATALTREPGASIAYKYYIRWDDSRFDETSENYIENLDINNGWEEPGATGGADRMYTFGNDLEQVVEERGAAFFNSIPEQGIIRETLSGETTLPVTFKVDMTAALTHTVPFVPATDKVYIMFETPFFGLTQGLPVGDGAPLFEVGNEDQRARVELMPVDGEPNIYSLTFDVMLPTENHMGFSISYVNPEGVRTGNGEGTTAGRRYYRYIEPLNTDDPDAIIWPDSYEAAPIEWKVPTTLDFEAPPTYGLGTSIDDGNFETPNAFQLYNNYPNPFNPSTNISFNLPNSEFVELSVFNILGQKVATVLSQQMTAGTHTVAFNARNMASGVYIYQIQAGSFVQNKTMMLVK